MKLPTKLVAVKRITSDIPRSCFSAEKIEKVARLIIEVEGIINPIILRRISLESYEVIAGHFEYYAAVRAREIELLKGEKIQAIILEPENETVLLEQVNLLRESSDLKPISEENNNHLEAKFINLENIFQYQFEELRRDNRNLERSIAQLENKVENSSLGEEFIDAIADKLLKAIPLSVYPSHSHKKSVDELKKYPVHLNLASEKELITVPGIGKEKAQLILQRKNKKGDFKNINELTEIRGITENTIQRYQWKEYLTIQDSSLEKN